MKKVIATAILTTMAAHAHADVIDEFNLLEDRGMTVEKKTYTGTLVKGIATMHKSNAVPIIDQEQATDIANMRRN